MMPRPAPAAVLAITALALLVSACGTEPRERAAGGAMTGAGAGFITGLAFGGVGALPGALIGAGAGATTGALTTRDEVYLGEPVWR